MLDVAAFSLCIPNDRGAVGLEEVGHGYWMRLSDRVIHVEAMYPVHPGAGRLVKTFFAGVRPGIWTLVGGWTGYAVTTTDGELVYAPEGVWRWAKRSNLYMEVWS